MKGRPYSMINRDGLQFIANEQGEIEIPEQYSALLKAYGFSHIVAIIEKEEPKEEPIIVEEKPLPIITKTIGRGRPKKSGNVKQKQGKR